MVMPGVSPAATSILSSTAVPTPISVREAIFQTSGGLRYADRDFYLGKLAQTATMAICTQVLAAFMGPYGVGIATYDVPPSEVSPPLPGRY